jgi:hypothetical protein
MPAQFRGPLTTTDDVVGWLADTYREAKELGIAAEWHDVPKKLGWSAVGCEFIDPDDGPRPTADQMRLVGEWLRTVKIPPGGHDVIADGAAVLVWQAIRIGDHDTARRVLEQARVRGALAKIVTPLMSLRKVLADVADSRAAATADDYETTFYGYTRAVIPLRDSADHPAEHPAAVPDRQNTEVTADEPTASAEDMLGRVALAVADDVQGAILKVAADTSKSADERIRMIYAIDNRVVSWKSAQWSRALAVSAPAVRQTDWWRKDRKRLRNR